MIIDPTYIKSVLNIEVSDEILNYLIKHFFNYVCKEVGLDSTLEEEEIATIPTTQKENPNILEDDLTLFQETIIYGIACELVETELIDNVMPENIYHFYQTDIEEVTFCNIFNYCLKGLDTYLNHTSKVKYVRQFLFLKETKISDEQLAFLIEEFTQDIISHLPEDVEVDTESFLFKQALVLQIACHLYKLKPGLMGPPKSYKVDEVRVTWTVGFDKEGNTWCDLAEEALADLKKKFYGRYGFVAWERPGARTKYGYHGPGGRT